MPATHDLQQRLFSYLKENLPSHLSLVDELSELLGLSVDSAYRRIRGEKPITLTELKKIAQHYQLSIDQFIQVENESVLFQAPGLNRETGTFADYLTSMLKQFELFTSFKIKNINYLCKDIPFWYFYLFPEIAAFKTFFWSKTINSYPSFSNQLFSYNEHPFEECFAIGQKIFQKYNQMNAVELWNLESIHSTINQVAYYRDAGIFKSRQDLKAVINSLDQLLDHLQLQAETGEKFMPGLGEASRRGTLQFYINELILGNNTILLELDDTRISMITYNVLHYLITKDERFVDKAFNNFNNLLSRSALISKTGEKDRNIFFNAMREKLDILKK